MQFHKAGLYVPARDIGTRRLQAGSCSAEVDGSINSSPEFVDMSFESELEFNERASNSGLQNNLGDLGGVEPSAYFKDVGVENGCNVVPVETGTFSLPQRPDSSSRNRVLVGELYGETRVDTNAPRCVGGKPGLETASTFIHVSRPKEVESGRMDLPIIMMEQEIMETVNNNSSVIISGETGCGKTTQVPQFLYEAGYGSGKCSMKSGVIGITQPRRVAVLSTAKRVAYELGLELGKEVGYQVRHDRSGKKKCSIKFMTDGILLQELKSDKELKRYSVIILDEAHERSVNTDILVGMLSHAIRIRKDQYEEQQLEELAGIKRNSHERVYPLKLILMSATLRVEDFTSGNRIFTEPPPIINIPTKQFPVTIHFSKVTKTIDYIGEAYKKVLKIHKKLPSGGILVFVTGQREVELLCHMLRQASRKFVSRSSEVNKESETTKVTGMGQIGGYSLEESESSQQINRFGCHDECHDKIYNNSAYVASRLGGDFESDFEDDECRDVSDDSDAYFAFSSGEESGLDIGSDFEDHHSSVIDNSIVDLTKAVNTEFLNAAFEKLTEETAPTLFYKKENISATQDVTSFQPTSLTKEKAERKRPVIGPLHVLPLYAKLSKASQLRVFEKTEEGERLVVVATNVAETSLTIPGIRYVVDTGREKVKEYNPSNGMESYKIKWTSKASASQRAGRAGRTGPGHCYCLYSSAALSNQFPEFSTPEILKTPVDDVVLLLKSIGFLEVANFPFPTPPDAEALANAERRLKILGALDSECGRVTPLGEAMAQYPIGPRHSKLLLHAIQILKEGGFKGANLVLAYAVAVAAALSFDNPFLSKFDGSQTNYEGKQQEEDSRFLGGQKTRDQQATSMTKQMRESANHGSANFANPKSDALTVAYALQLFEQSKNQAQFCEENMLHLKTMLEMSKLRKQLLKIVFKLRNHGLQPDFSWSCGTMRDVEDSWAIASDKFPLLQVEEDVLLEAICAGWLDRVAKRTRRGASVSSEGDRKVNVTRYQTSSLVENTVFLGHWSSVSEAAAEFLVYIELNCTKRPYIHRATSVKPEWLAKLAGPLLCKFSTPDAKPLYDRQCDQVFNQVIPYFGPHLWKLPSKSVPIEDVEQRTKVFAYALLDGQVLKCVNTVKKLMVSSPSSIFEPGALAQKRVCNLICRLQTKSIDSFAKLREAWKENSLLLYVELLNFFQKGAHGPIFDKLWEVMHKESFLEPQRTRKIKCSDRV